MCVCLCAVYGSLSLSLSLCVCVCVGVFCGSFVYVVSSKGFLFVLKLLALRPLVFGTRVCSKNISLAVRSFFVFALHFLLLLCWAFAVLMACTCVRVMIFVLFEVVAVGGEKLVVAGGEMASDGMAWGRLADWGGGGVSNRGEMASYSHAQPQVLL